MGWPNPAQPGIILARPVNPVNRFRQIAAFVSFDTSRLGRLGLRRRRGSCFRLLLLA
jgi:hypothetical protein